jgi:filamentous hemagglutinin
MAGASDALAAYKAAQAGYSLTTAAATGAAVSGGTYTAAAAATAFVNYLNTGQTFTSSFDQKFSFAGLAAASTVGAYNSMFGTLMFSWAGIPNGLSNLFSVPGAVIRLNGFFLGQAAGKAAQGAVNQSK